MARDSEKTKAKIIRALGTILAHEGFAAVGVNAVAREAGVDKVLIYRYFDGLPGLLRAFFYQGDYWPTIGELIGGNLTEIGRMDRRELSKAILLGHLRELRKRPITQEIMRWEQIERNKLTDELARLRETQGLEIMDLLPQKGDAWGRDLNAVAALLTAGITYLILRAKTADEFNGVPLHTEEGRRRIEQAVTVLIDAYFERCEQMAKSEKGRDDKKKA